MHFYLLRRDWDEGVFRVGSARSVTSAFPSPGQHIKSGFHLKKPYGLEAPRRHPCFGTIVRPL